MEKLSDSQKQILQEHEAILQICRDLILAERSMKIIQGAFLDQRDHHRLLQAKLYYYEVLLDAGRTAEASLGFEGIYARANKGTRTYLESRAFLGICHLRNRKIDLAEEHIKYVIENTKNIRSDSRRIQFYDRLVTRIQEECILGQLIGRNEGALEMDDIHSKSIAMVKKSESELFEQIAQALPLGTQALVTTVTNRTLRLLPVTDQKCLPAPVAVLPKTEMGKKALAALKRIAWKSFCDKTSNVFKLWDKGIPKVFNEGYFSLAIITTLNQWKIGLPQLAAGLAATAMRFGCAEFCTQFRPEGLMIPRSEKA